MRRVCHVTDICALDSLPCHEMTNLSGYTRAHRFLSLSLCVCACVYTERLLSMLRAVADSRCHAVHAQVQDPAGQGE